MAPFYEGGRPGDSLSGFPGSIRVDTVPTLSTDSQRFRAYLGGCPRSVHPGRYDMAAERTEQVMVRLTPDIYEELRVRSDEEERTIAQTVRLAIRQYLANQDLVDV